MDGTSRWLWGSVFAAACWILCLPAAQAAPWDSQTPAQVGHLLNRAAYGPSPADLKRVRELGIKGWIDEQLNPESIGDAALESRIGPLFETSPAGKRIKGVAELKTLAHLYAIYSRRQLQSVLADFWENHFITDYDKVADYFDKMQNSDASDTYTAAEAAKEAVHLEHLEYEFFRRHALGNFGELLRHSARSPAMVIYLDSVLNVKSRANENYAREILELHSFGVDNGYVQPDIEQLAKCFTGWGLAKVAPKDAGNPHAPTGVRLSDLVLAAPGEKTPASEKNWRYLKGTAEPPSNWRSADFDDSKWLEGPAGIGYGDNDDATVLADMQNKYSTVYMRKTFTLGDPKALKEHLIFSVLYDDGFVAYLNGTEVLRINAPGKPGEPVPHKALATQGHEAGGIPTYFNFNKFRSQLKAGKNVLAIQVLNNSLASSDLTMIPTLIDRNVLPGSIENNDPRGVFAFHFFADLHNTADKKVLFKGKPHQLEVDGRSGADGLAEAEIAIQRILDHPSTAQFICTKLIQKLVGDEIDFRKPGDGPYAALLARCVTTWNATNPKGNIKEVVRAILTSDEFWLERTRAGKIKDPFEFIASSVRALDAQTPGTNLVAHLRAMGMELFTRNDPDGWPEVGSELIDTGTFQNRLAFVLALSGGTAQTSPDLHWDPAALLGDASLATPEKIVGAFNELLFQGGLSKERTARVIQYLKTDEKNQPLPLSRDRPDFAARVRQAAGLMLSFPHWQYQ